jgi:hypothetical protein
VKTLGELITGPTDEEIARDSPFESVGLFRELRQSEILSDITRLYYNPVDGSLTETIFKYVIVMSQDCDLLWDFEKFTGGRSSDFNEVLLVEALVASEYKVHLNDSGIWKRLDQNRDDRYHYLEPVPKALDLESIGLPALVVDFKRVFSLPPRDIERQISADTSCKRRCKLKDLYKEHLQSRFAFYFQRVALPRPHNNKL